MNETANFGVLRSAWDRPLWAFSASHTVTANSLPSFVNNPRSHTSERIIKDAFQNPV
jgi:hypothetical protein